MRHFVAVVMLILFLGHPNHTFGYEILGIFPSVMRSHSIPGQRLMLELARLGHNVTVICPFPSPNPPDNYRNLDTASLFHVIFGQFPSITEVIHMNLLQQHTFLNRFGAVATNFTLHHPNVQALLNDPSEHFDVVIQHGFGTDAMHGIAHHFKAPIVSVSLSGANFWNYDMVGTPVPLSYCSSFMLPYIGKLTLLEKLHSTINGIAEYLLQNYYYFPLQERIYNEVFPDPKPPLADLHRNVSLVLLNQHFTLNFPRPYVPNMIEIGGIHLNRNAKPLPVDIQQFLDSAKYGAIYLSLGTIVPPSLIARTRINDLIKTFSKLKQHVLWKIELTDYKNLPENILIRNWLPQEDILAHPNMKLFITHGGLLSLMESLYHRIPIIGIPFASDQRMNMRKVLTEGIGIALEQEEISETALTDAINEVLSNKKYIANVNSLSDRFQDQPMSPMKTAVYWIEYVARHKGAPHMRSPSQDMNFIQYHNLDAFGILLAVLLLIVYGIKRIILRLINRKQEKIQKKLKKP